MDSLVSWLQHMGLRCLSHPVLPHPASVLSIKASTSKVHFASVIDSYIVISSYHPSHYTHRRHDGAERILGSGSGQRCFGLSRGKVTHVL